MWHVMASSFGIAAAVLLVGGYMALQWQRNRHRYELMRAALDQGIAEFPDRIPYWLVSLRQGAMILVLGIALLVVGGAACYLVRGIEAPDMPPVPSNAAPTNAAVQPIAPVPSSAAIVQSTATGGEREVPSSPQGEKPKPPPADHPPPPGPNPALERWHQAESQRSVGLATIGCGFALVLLGVVRIGFARIERKYLISK